MRLLVTLHDPIQAQQFAQILEQHHIQANIETTVGQDWGHESYGNPQITVWIVNEDDLVRANNLLTQFQIDPNSLGQFYSKEPPAHTTTPILQIKRVEEKTAKPYTPTFEPPPVQPLGYATFYLLLACIFIFMVSEFSAGKVPRQLPNLPAMPLVSSPTKKALLYDYPLAYERVDDLVKQYGIPALLDPNSLPAEGRKEFIQAQLTPYWKGIYPYLVAKARNKPYSLEGNGELFEKLRQGEAWRLVSPIFLHGDIFHILFNMLWLLLLGRQIEQHIGSNRLLLFVAITAAVTNTVQYLMTGPNFLGFSGVLCAMLAFIWQRQVNAPWEGYPLQKSTINFMLFFVAAMAAIQFIAFGYEVYAGKDFPFGLANAAHLSGLALGYYLGRYNFFPVKDDV